MSYVWHLQADCNWADYDSVTVANMLNAFKGEIFGPSIESNGEG